MEVASRLTVIFVLSVQVNNSTSWAETGTSGFKLIVSVLSPLTHEQAKRGRREINCSSTLMLGLNAPLDS